MEFPKDRRLFLSYIFFRKYSKCQVAASTTFEMAKAKNAIRLPRSDAVWHGVAWRGGARAAT